MFFPSTLNQTKYDECIYRGSHNACSLIKYFEI